MEFNATFIVSAISFIVFTFIMNAIFYKPLGDVVAQRQKFIDETNEEAKLHREKSAAILKDKEHKLGNTKQDAKKIIAEKTNEVKTQKSAMTTEAQQKAVQTIDGAKGELQVSKNQAQDVLADQVVNLAQDISSKILGQGVVIDNVDKELINKVIKGEG